MEALENRDVDFAKVLIKYGANLNLQDAGGNTPLHTIMMKVLKEYEPLLSVLIEHGADIFIENIGGVSCYKLSEFYLK